MDESKTVFFLYNRSGGCMYFGVNGSRHERCALSANVVRGLVVAFVFLLLFTPYVSAQCSLLNETFSSAPTLSATNVDGAWYPDRFPPAGFTNATLGSDNVLKISIAGVADGLVNRPAAYQSTFYNTQGRKINQCGQCAVHMTGSLYIPASWATAHRRTDMWATAYDVTNTVSLYPIIGFRNIDGISPNISYWDDNTGWVNLGAPSTYDTWYTFEFEIVGSNLVYRVNGSTVGTISAGGSTYLGDIIMQAYNFNDASLGSPSTDSYDAYWDNLISTGPGGNVVTNLNTSEKFCTIQQAIDATNTVSGHVISVGPGTYSEKVTVSKSLTIQGVSEPNCIVNGTGLGNGSGFTVNNGITGVTIKYLTIKNHAGTGPNSYAGIYAVGGNDNITVQHCTIKDNVGGCGFYANGPVDYVTLDNLDVSGHTNVAGAARGIVIWNGFKTHISITNCAVYNNACCGIELQDGTASGVTISNNNVHNNADNGIAATGLMSGAGANVISSNTINSNGRFGIEVKLPNGTGLSSGDGSIVVTGNTITGAAISDLRDMAGIAVMRRGWVAGNNNVDVPTGVQLNANAVSGYTQSSTSDGFGIVIEGTNHTITGNTVTGNDVGVQQQAGHLPYVANTNTDGDQSNVADTYFGRGNSPITCGNTIAGNTITGNTVDTRDVVSAGSYGLVVNTTTGKLYCSIQAAIDDALTVDGHTLSVHAGTFSENVVVNKSLTLLGPNANTDCSGSRVPEASIVGLGGANTTALSVAANNVTVNGLSISNPTGSFGISSHGRSNVAILYNVVSDIGDNTSGSGASYGIQIESSAAASNVSITNNCVSNIRGGQSTPTSGSNGSGNGIGANSSNSTADLSGLDISSNKIWNISACATNGTGGKGAYGVIINVGAAVGGTGKAISPTVTNNSISALNGRWSHGVGLEGDTPGASVLNNDFSSFTSAAGDNVGVRIEDNDGASTVQIHDNSILNGGPAIFNSSVGFVNATCNWYGTTVNAAIASLIGGNVLYSPYLNSGTDNSASIGFQPIVGSCTGGIPKLSVSINGVVVDANNDATTDEGTFSVCNTSNNILFNSVTDQNGLADANLRVYQTYSATNVTVPFCNNCWATMAAFAGANGTAALVNPALPGTLVMTFQSWIDTDNSGTINGSEVFSDVIQYTITVDPLPSATAGGSVTICSNGTATVSGASASNGSVLWTSTGGGILDDPTTLTPTYHAVTADAGTTITLTMTVSGSASCVLQSATAIYSISVDALPTATAGGTQTICANATATVSGASSSNGVIFWTENGAGSISAGQGTVTPTYTPAAGDAGNTVTLTMTVTSNNACSPQFATAYYTVVVNGAPIASAGGSQTICVNGTATVSGASSSNGTRFWTENGAGSITAGQGTLTPTYTPGAGDAGNTVTLTLTVTSNNACAPQTAQATYSVQVKPALSVSIAQSDLPAQCQGMKKLTATVSGASGSPTFSWSPGGATVSTITALSNGTYSVTVTDANGCPVTVSTVVNVSSANLPLSAYVMLGKTGVELRGTTVNGNVGVRNNNAWAQIREGSNVTGIVRADNLTQNGGSTIGSYSNGQCVALPAFPNYSTSSNSNVTVNQGQTVTLNGTNYRDITIHKNATVTFSAATVTFRNLNCDDHVTINFSQDATFRLTGSADLDASNSFNSAAKKVIMYVASSFNLGQASVFKGWLYVNCNLTVDGPGNATTTMTGQFLSSGSIYSSKYNVWNAGAACTLGNGLSRDAIVADDDPSNDGTIVPETLDENVNVYPNPVQRIAHVVMREVTPEALTMSVFNQIGNKIKETLFAPNTQAVLLDISGPEFPSGTYFIRVEGGSHVYTKAFVILK